MEHHGGEGGVDGGDDGGHGGGGRPGGVRQDDGRAPGQVGAGRGFGGAPSLPGWAGWTPWTWGWTSLAQGAAQSSSDNAGAREIQILKIKLNIFG